MKRESLNKTKKSVSDIFINFEVPADGGVLKKALDRLLSAAAYTNPIEAYTAALEAANVQPNESPVTHEQWEQLYEVTKNIRLLAPWKYLHESERITLLLPGRDEPVYIVVMGNGNMTYGIGIYPGYDSLARLLRMTESEADESNLSIAFEQHCINLYFGDREELESRDRDVIKKLGLKFRGKNEWPYFRSMKPGYMPWFMNAEEAEMAIAALQNFAMACVAYLDREIEVDFEEAETLLRFYDSETEMWYNTAIKMPPIPIIQPKLINSDEILIATLKKKKKNRMKIAFSMTYLPLPLHENKNERPRIPRMALLTDIGSGSPIDQVTSIENEFIGKEVIEMLTRYITEHGRPSSIAVQNDEASCYIADFAQKLGIEIVEDEIMSSANDFIMGLMNMIESGQLEDLTQKK